MGINTVIDCSHSIQTLLRLPLKCQKISSAEKRFDPRKFKTQFMNPLFNQMAPATNKDYIYWGLTIIIAIAGFKILWDVLTWVLVKFYEFFILKYKIF
jgi:hypothetical protein